MNYKKLSAETWKNLDDKGNIVAGYKSIWISVSDRETSHLHIFRDEAGKFHFAIESSGISKKDLYNPEVNGLSVSLNQYRLADQDVRTFIDIQCSLTGLIEEFTEVVREISVRILENKQSSLSAVNQVLRNWKTFWTHQIRNILSEAEQIGLICELTVLNSLCKINSGLALDSWVGPLGKKHDYNFSEWCIEVKGTRQKGHVHTINGIDQLKPCEGKKLAMISYLVSVSGHEHSVSLQDMIDLISDTILKTRADLAEKFNELLAASGYSPIYAKEYRKFRIEILEGILHVVDSNFPRLTSDDLKHPLNSRISDINYSLSLDGITGEIVHQINWGNYIY